MLDRLLGRMLKRNRQQKQKIDRFITHTNEKQRASDHNLVQLLEMMMDCLLVHSMDELLDCWWVELVRVLVSQTVKERIRIDLNIESAVFVWH